jgi:hypothetical protein
MGRKSASFNNGSFPGITAPQQQWPVYLDQRTSGEMHLHA